MGQPIKYKKGDLVGKQNIEMISDSWVPEGKSNATRRSNFKCPYCFEKNLSCGKEDVNNYFKILKKFAIKNFKKHQF